MILAKKMRWPGTLLLVLACAACRSQAPKSQAPRTAPAQPAPFRAADAVKLGSELRPTWGGNKGWIDGKSYVTADKVGTGRALVKVEAESGRPTLLRIPQFAKQAFAALPGMDEKDLEALLAREDLLPDANHGSYLLNRSNDLFYWSGSAAPLVRLTNDPAEEVGELLAPDGKSVAYVKDHNLYVVSVDGGAERRLTSAGDLDHLHGRLDWVYQEEVYGRGNFQGFWWSGDSSRIAYLVLDQTPVPKFTLVDDRTVHPKVETWRYPKSGDPNPIASLHVVDAATGAARAIDLSRYAGSDFLIVRVGWTEDGTRLLFAVQDRIQTWLDLLVADPASGAAQLLLRDQTPSWIEPLGLPHWVDGGKRFLWLSERSGYKHLYLYAFDGAAPAARLERALTSGPFEVDDLHGVDARGWVYFDCDRDDVKGSQLYRVRLDGTGLERLTRGGGVHAIDFAPGLAYYIDSTSSLNDPGRVDLCRADGSLVRTLATGNATKARELGLCAVEFHQPKTRDGFELEAYLIKPPDFDPQRKYPVVCHVYSGPHAPKVRDQFGGFDRAFHHHLARAGYLVWVCDNRSATGKGLASTTGVWKNLGSQELADIEDGLDWLVARGFADPERVAIWGWSYGGYMTAFAMTHSKRFKLGIAGAPVTDWTLYDSIYTERLMDLPSANPDGYRRSSVLEAAKDLSGKLLLIHGAIDENVHPQNSLMLAQRLQRAGKDFELMIYPGNRHHVGDPEQRAHLYAAMERFLVEGL
jgi:dipeptidyl-peptidase-4